MIRWSERLGEGRTEGLRCDGAEWKAGYGQTEGNAGSGAGVKWSGRLGQGVRRNGRLVG